MGSDHSKTKNVTDSVTDNSTSNSEESPPLMKYDEWMLQVITEDLENETQMFVVNNMLMSVQFFGNYQKEVLHEDILELDNDLNKTLLKQLGLSCINPDYLLDAVNDRVRFVTNTMVDQNSTSVIAPRRLYVVNDIFEVVDISEELQDSTVDKTSYRVKLEPSRIITDNKKKIPGYVRLKLIEHLHSADCQISSALKKVKESDARPSESTSKGDSKPKPEEYTLIVKSNTTGRLNDDVSTPQDCLPLCCFTCLLDEKQATEICIQSEEVNGNLGQIELFDKSFYGDAKGYMRYFKNNIFPKSLGKALGLSDMEIKQQARSIPGKILCKSTNKEKDLFECEIIPCVFSTLPSDFKFSFEQRSDEHYAQNISSTTEQHLYNWPTEQMIKEIQRMNCMLVPKGYWRKNTNHEHANLDWEISFPVAEKYLFSKMSHTQIRCYLFLLLIHKAYIEPKTKYQGLQVEHIMHHIFWECWRNFLEWPEHRLGYKLKEVIESLMCKISKHYLPDYFIKGKNLFENVPIKFLYIASEELQNVLEQPAMCLVKILRSLRYTADLPEFYRELDVRKLIEMLYLTGMDIASPQLPVPTENRNLTNLQKYVNPETRVEYIKMQKRRHARTQQLQKTGSQKTKCDDSKWPCKKYFDGDKIKISHILLFFAEHFMSLATFSFQNSTTKQTRFFLRQAWYLAKIKEGLGSSYSQEAFKNLLRDIQKMEEDLYRKELIPKDSEVLLISDESRAGILKQKDESSNIMDEEQVERRVKAGRRNRGKSVSFLEPSLEDFI